MKRPTNTLNRLRLALGSLLVLHAAAPQASAQKMPQDNWRWDYVAGSPTDSRLQFSGPVPTNQLGAIAIGSGGVYVAENTMGTGMTSVLQFTEGGIYQKRFTTTFTNVQSIACDSAGNVYVLDIGASTVTKLDPNGNFLLQWGSAGSGNGQFNLTTTAGTLTPYMIAVNPNDQIYVCDPGNTRMQVFDSSGTFLRQWGTPGTLPSQFPTGAAPRGVAINKVGQVYVPHLFTGGLVVFGSNDVYVSGPINGSPVISPDGLIWAVNFSWNGYPTDYLFYDSAGNLVSDNNQNLSYPTVVAFSKNGNLFVVTTAVVNGTGQNVVKVYKREYSNVKNSLSPPAIPQPMVLACKQRSNTYILDIDYLVTDADSPTVTTGLLAFWNGGTTLNDVVQMKTFLEGANVPLGPSQTTGVSHHVSWNMPADWTADYAQVQVEALANDNRNLLGFQWITVPASGTNAAIQVSVNTLTDAALLDVWFYLLATNQPGISLTNGNIYGADGTTTLASGTTTTSAGRQYLFNLLNVRAITSDEVTRAQGGNYGFTGVDANSVVKVATP